MVEDQRSNGTLAEHRRSYIVEPTGDDDRVAWLRFLYGIVNGARHMAREGSVGCQVPPPATNCMAPIRLTLCSC